MNCRTVALPFRCIAVHVHRPPRAVCDRVYVALPDEWRTIDGAHQRGNRAPLLFANMGLPGVVILLVFNAEAFEHLLPD